MYELKTNTAYRIAVGPLVDPTDGKTAETGLTVTGMVVDIIQMDNDGTAVNRTSFSPTASGGNNDMIAVPSSTVGMYDLELTAAQLNFLGNARLAFYDVDGFLVHWIDIQVVSAAYFDWKYGTTIPNVNCTQISGDGTAADNCEAFFDGTGYAGGTTKLGVDIVSISGDSTAADNCEKAYDGTGYTYTNCTMPTTTAITNEVTADVTKISGDATAANNLEAALDGTGGVTITAALTGNITGNLSGSVGSVTGAVGSVTGAVGSVAGNVDGSVASVTAGVTLANDAITAAKFDESTAFPLKSADTGATAVARTGADSDTLETLSDEIAAAKAVIDNIHDTDLPAVKTDTAAILTDTGTTLDGKIDSILEDTGTTLPATLATIDGIVDDILVDTGTTLPASIAGIAAAVWNYLVSAMTTVGSIGKAFADWLPITPSGTSPVTASDVIVCNNALMMLGNNAITALTDETKAARICAQFYTQVKNAVIRAYTWNCAIARSEALVAGDTPEFGFGYSYELPDDCLRVLTIEDDETIPFRVEGGLLLTDDATCKITYIKQVDIEDADELLIQAISARLAATIAFALTNSTSGSEAMWKLYKDILDEAQTIDAFEGTAPQMASDDWVNSRR